MSNKIFLFKKYKNILTDKIVFVQKWTDTTVVTSENEEFTHLDFLDKHKISDYIPYWW